jgi:O-antigen/teichoic acid export membrane protein
VTKDLVKDALRYIPAHLGPAIIGIVTVPILTRLFDPSEYGDYMLVMVTATFLAGIAGGWLAESVIRFYPCYASGKGEERFHNTVFVFSLVSAVVAGLLLLGAAVCLKGAIPHHMRRFMYLGAGILVLQVFLQVLCSFLRAQRQIGWYTTFTLLYDVLSLTCGVMLVLLVERSVEFMLWSKLLVLILILPVLYKLSVGRSISVSRGVSAQIAAETASYGFPIVLCFTTFWLLSFSDRYFIQIYRGSQEVGIYSVSYVISERCIMMMMGLFVAAGGPMAMTIWVRDGEQTGRIFLERLSRHMIMVCLPAVVGLSVLAGPIISLMASSKYLEGSRIIPFIAFGFLFNSIAYCYALVFNFTKKTYVYSMIAATAAISNVVLNLILVPQYGYMAAAITTLVSYFVYLVLTIAVSRRYFIWVFPLSFLAKASLASGVMAVVVRLTMKGFSSLPGVNLLGAIALGMLTYSLALVVVGGFSLKEIAALKLLSLRLLEGRVCQGRAS